jgi:hypothetical protein
MLPFASESPSFPCPARDFIHLLGYTLNEPQEEVALRNAAPAPGKPVAFSPLQEEAPPALTPMLLQLEFPACGKADVRYFALSTGRVRQKVSLTEAFLRHTESQGHFCHDPR